MSVEQALRAHLDSQAAATPPAPTTLAAEALRTYRERRRARRNAGLGAVGVAALTAGIVAGVVVIGDQFQAADRQAAAPAGSALAFGTRGELRFEFIGSTIRQRAWNGPNPPATDRTLAYAGDIPGARIALVTGEDDGLALGQWYVGPLGADGDAMSLLGTPFPITASDPVTLLLPNGDQATLVVLASADDQITITDADQSSEDLDVLGDGIGTAIATVDRTLLEPSPATVNSDQPGALIPGASGLTIEINGRSLAGNPVPEPEPTMPAATGALVPFDSAERPAGFGSALVDCLTPLGYGVYTDEEDTTLGYDLEPGQALAFGRAVEDCLTATGLEP